MQNILLLSGLPVSKPTVRYAAALAGRWNGHLTGLHVSAPPNLQLDPGRPAAMSMQLQWEQDRIARARAAADDFERYAGVACHGRCSWKTVTGVLAEVVAAFANWHDLLLVQRGPAQPGGSLPALAQLILTSSVPLFVLPPEANESLRLDRIVVLWDGSPEATRALHSARTCLRTASEVILIASTGDEVSRENFDPCAYLLAHGVAHTLLAVDTSEVSATTILAAIEESRPDLLVLGARGNARFGEWRLDACCCQLLQGASAAVFTVS